jgi:hypothetical protein
MDATSEKKIPVRIGILGVASIASSALINPTKENSEVVVAAVAVRDTSRAHAFAAEHGIARVHESAPQVDRAMTAELRLPGGHRPGPLLDVVVECGGRKRPALHRLRVCGPIGPMSTSAADVQLAGGRRVPLAGGADGYQR